MLDLIKKDYQFTNLVIVYSISFILFLLILLLRELLNKDLKYLYYSYHGCNLWCLTHILLYIILSYISPKYWWFLFGFGLLFEFLELYLSNFSKFVKSNINTDIIFNSIGILLGLLLHKIYPKKIDLQQLFKEYILFYKNIKFNKEID